MKTQKEFLVEVLAELADLKQMVKKINDDLAYLKTQDQQRQSTEYRQQNKSVTLWVDGGYEFGDPRIHLTSDEWLWVRSGINFCIWGNKVYLDDERTEPMCDVVWEFNRSENHQLVATAYFEEEEDGWKMEEMIFYEGKIRKDMIEEDR